VRTIALRAASQAAVAEFPRTGEASLLGDDTRDELLEGAL
jgi:hypothetical protein